MKTIFASALSLLLLMSSAVVQALDVTEPDSKGRIGNWMVLGPFPHGGCFEPLADILEPETTVPCLGDTEAGKTWEAYVPAELGGEWVSQCIDFPVGSCNGGRGIDLNCHYSGDIRTQGEPEFVMAYAFTYLMVDSDMKVQIRTGSDDGYRYYLDGVLIVDGTDACRCYEDDQETVGMTLTAGIHRVLVQVGEHEGHWGFTFRITDTSGNPITSGIRADLVSDSDGDGVPDCDDLCPDSDPVLDPDVRTHFFWKGACKKPAPWGKYSNRKQHVYQLPYWSRKKPQPPGEQENLPGYVDRVNDTATFADVTDVDALCDRLHPAPWYDKREKAEAQFMALLLNVSSGRVTECNCVVDPDLPENSTVRDAVDFIDVLLSDPECTFKDCILAQSIADALNNGLSLVDCDAEVVSPEPFHHFHKRPTTGRFPRFPRLAHPGSAER